MAKAGKSAKRKSPQRTKTLAIGREGFAKISAIDGVVLSPEQYRIVDELKRQNMSAEKRRTYLAGKYGFKIRKSDFSA